VQKFIYFIYFILFYIIELCKLLNFIFLIIYFKHFAIHSGPESQRHTFNAHVSKRDLYTTYLPAFKALVTEFLLFILLFINLLLLLLRAKVEEVVL
jgi:hypothetical protein